MQTTELDNHAEAIARDGYTVLERVIEPDLVAQLQAAIDRVMVDAAIPFGENRFLGHNTRRIFNLLARDPLFARVPLHPAVLPLVERVLDDQCLLSSLTAIEMNSGQGAQPLHSDDGSISLPRPHVPVVCVAIWALTDFTTENGATRLVPGSHRSERRPAKGEQADFIEATMPAGSVLVYDGRAVAWRRRQHHGRAARGHRGQPLRGLPPPGGEPTARRAPRDGGDVPPPVAADAGLRRLQGPDGPRRQAGPRRVPRPRRRDRHGMEAHALNRGPRRRDHGHTVEAHALNRGPRRRDHGHTVEAHALNRGPRRRDHGHTVEAHALNRGPRRRDHGHTVEAHALNRGPRRRDHDVDGFARRPAGNHVAMATWRVERNEPVRADAPGVFIGHHELGGADIGDAVVVVGAGDEWHGVVVEHVDRDDGRYVRLKPAPPQ